MKTLKKVKSSKYLYRLSAINKKQEVIASIDVYRTGFRKRLFKVYLTGITLSDCRPVNFHSLKVAKDYITTCCKLKQKEI